MPNSSSPVAPPPRRQTLAERRAAGKAARKHADRSRLADWKPASDRRDAVELLRSQDAQRLPDLVPIRYGRMAASPFAFLRGAALVMADDLLAEPHSFSGFDCQLCGDAHLSNFGVFASPERELLFDVNDFDETHAGPWEYDLQRLAASLYVASIGNGCTSAEARAAAHDAVASYQAHMAEYAEMRWLELYYAKVSTDDITRVLSETDPAAAGAATAEYLKKAWHHDNVQALHKLTEVRDGRLQIKYQPPLLMPLDDETRESVRGRSDQYRRTLQHDRRVLFDRYKIIDIGLKVVGVGSVGTRSWIALFLGRDEDDPLFLQIKEACWSVLSGHLGRSHFANHGERVVVGQRLMQAASDIFLGWVKDANDNHYYVRQLRDMKLSVDPRQLDGERMRRYGVACGWVLARAHANSGDPVAIAGYLGDSDRFAASMAAFAEAYAEVNAADHAKLLEAIASGAVQAEDV